MSYSGTLYLLQGVLHVVADAVHEMCINGLDEW